MNSEIWLSAAAVLCLPGAALLRLLRPRDVGVDRATTVASAAALGLAFWPLLFLWTSFTPIHWNSWLVRAVVGAAAAVAFFRKEPLRFVRRITLSELLLILILIVTVWTRLRTIDGVVLPPWVDSVHHTMLVRLFVDRGTVPADYEPFIHGASAFYHWGYHAITSAVCWFSGRTEPFDIAFVVLSFGQFLNALTPLFVYSAARSLTRSSTAAVIDAALASLVSYYPAYYVSWGRYTHLAGVLLLLSWITMAARARRLTPRSVVTLAIVAAALALVHVRLAFFAVMLTLVLIGASILRKRRPTALLAGGAVALAFACPWLIQLMRTDIVASALVPSEADARWRSPAEVRENLLWVPHTAELLSVATAGLSGIANIGPLSIATRVLSGLWWIAILFAATRRRRRTKALMHTVALLLAWVVLTLFVLNGTRMQFATNTSAAITAFVPICIAAGALIAWFVSVMLARWRRAILMIVVAIAVAVGLATLSDVINPATIIASPADIAALRWIRTALPASSGVIGRVRPWYGGAFIGVDGAYWSSVLTDRRSLPPPTLYGWSGTPQSRAETELFLARWQDEYPFATAASVDEARRLGVTHVYFGRGTPPEAAPRVGRIVYARDGIEIAELRN